MAIDPNNLEITNVPNLPNGAFSLLNYVIQSNPTGTVTKGTQSDFATFLAPFVSAVGSSGYVAVSSNSLPSPSGTNSFSFVSKGVFTHTAGNLTTNGDINIISWNGTAWSLVKEINIDLSKYAKKSEVQYIADSFGKQSIIDNGFFDVAIDGYQNTGGTLSWTGTSAKFTVSNAQGLTNFRNIPKGDYAIDVKAKMNIKGDGKLGVGLQGINVFVDMINDGKYHVYTFNITSTADQTNFNIWNENFGYTGNQEIEIEYIIVYNPSLGLVGDVDNLIKDVDFLTEEIGLVNIISNGFFDNGFIGWAKTRVADNIYTRNDVLVWESVADSGITNPQDLIAGNYKIEINAKLVAIGDGKLGVGVNGINKFTDLLRDGKFHNYTFEFDVETDAPDFTIWNQFFGFPVGQNIEIKHVLVYNNTSGISSRVSYSEKEINEIQEILGTESVIPNGVFQFGFTGWNKSVVADITTIQGRYLRWETTKDSGIINVNKISSGSYKVLVKAKLVSKGDGKIGVGIQGVNNFVDLINDGLFHIYNFNITASSLQDFILWNQNFGSVLSQSILIEYVKILDVSKGIINSNSSEKFDYSLPSDINHVISYGQSLSMGASAASITNTAFSPDMLMFSIEPYDATGDFIPLAIPDVSLEVPYAGTAVALHELAQSRGHSFANSQFLFSYAGTGGASIDFLSKTGGGYARFITHVQNGLAKSAQYGKSYCLHTVEWTQGETDYINMPKSEYRAKLIQLKNDINADVKAITGQANDVIFVMYQPSSFNSKQVSPSDYNKDFVTVYEELSLNVPGFYFGNPNYDKVFTVEDGGNTVVHLNAISYKRMGAEYGLIIDKIITGRDYKRLTLLSHSFQGKLINLYFNKDLAIDTLSVNSIANYGFLLSGNTINSVTVKDNRLTISCANNVSGGSVLSYAFNATNNAGSVSGPRGNIRSTEVNQFSFGTTYDWFAHSKITL